MTSVAPTPPLPPGMTVFQRGWLSSNNILFRGPEGAALVDSGYASHAGQTVALVRQALGPQPLQRLINTHLHSDHVGGNAALQAAWPGLHTAIPPGLAPQVRAWDPVALTYEPTGQVCPRFAIDDVLTPGQTLLLAGRDWQVHAAPGHDPHAVVLFEPISRTLISADALWERGFGVVFPELEGEQAFDEVGQTLDLIETLAPAVIVPGHGAVFTDLAGALAIARERLRAYRADPPRHSRHAAKVLLKFKLLEWQTCPEAEVLAWATATPYFRLIHSRLPDAPPLPAWTTGLLDDLVRAGAAERQAGLLHNRD